MNTIRFEFDDVCPHCGERFPATLDLTHNDLVPRTCSGIEPKGHATFYEVTSADIQKYLQEKVRSYNPDTKILADPLFTEPSQRSWEIHRAYAVIAVAFSGDVIDDPLLRQGAPDWLIEGIGRTRVVQSVANEVINRYRLSKDDFDRDYRRAEEISHQFGITNAFADVVNQFMTPHIKKTKQGAAWVIVTLSAAKIIADMLSSEESKRLEGDLVIQDVQKVSDDLISFSVFVRDGESTVSQSTDPHVKALLDSVIKSSKR